MTVYFNLDNISFTVSGTRHLTPKPGMPSFDLHSIRVQGNCANIRDLLNGSALERIAEAAAEAADDGVPFAAPQPMLPIELAEGGQS